MARPVVVGPLRIWAVYGSHGDRIAVELNGERAEYGRNDRTARAVLAWQAYRERLPGPAVSYTHSPKG